MAGKTSLTRSLISGNQYRTFDEERTIVAELRQIDTEDEVISVVDMGGHPSYQYSSLFFLLDDPSTVVLLCHKANEKSVDETFYWLKISLGRAPKAHIIPVITQSDIIATDDELMKYKQMFITQMKVQIEKEIKSLQKIVNKKSKSILRFRKLKTDNSDQTYEILKTYENLHSTFADLLKCVSTAPDKNHMVDELRNNLLHYSKDIKEQLQLEPNIMAFYMQNGSIGSKASDRFEKNRTPDKSNENQRKQSVKLNPESFDKPNQNKQNRIEATNEVKERQIDSAKTSISPNIFGKDGDEKHVQESLENVDFKMKKSSINTDDIQNLQDQLKKKRTFKHLTFKLSKKQLQEMNQILDIPGEITDEYVKYTLSKLHKRGLMFWFEGSENLQSIVFNDLKFFNDMLKVIFNHNIKDIKFEDLIEKLRQSMTESEFNKDKQYLTEHGLLSRNLLQLLLSRDNMKLDASVIIDLLLQMDIAVLYKGDYLFIPYFLDIKHIKPEIEEEISTWNRCSSSALCLTTIIQGNIPAIFYSLFIVKLYEIFNQDDVSHNIEVWNRGLKASMEKFDLLCMYDGQQSIKLSLKGIPKNITNMWNVIKESMNIVKQLKKTWWPGAVTDHILLCSHCLIENQLHPEKDIHEIELKQQILYGSRDDVVFCGNTKEKFPMGLVVPFSKKGWLIFCINS